MSVTSGCPLCSPFPGLPWLWVWRSLSLLPWILAPSQRGTPASHQLINPAVCQPWSFNHLVPDRTVYSCGCTSRPTSECPVCIMLLVVVLSSLVTLFLLCFGTSQLCLPAYSLPATARQPRPLHSFPQPALTAITHHLLPSTFPNTIALSLFPSPPLLIAINILLSHYQLF